MGSSVRLRFTLATAYGTLLVGSIGILGLPFQLGNSLLAWPLLILLASFLAGLAAGLALHDSPPRIVWNFSWLASLTGATLSVLGLFENWRHAEGLEQLVWFAVPFIHLIMMLPSVFTMRGSVWLMQRALAVPRSAAT